MKRASAQTVKNTLRFDSLLKVDSQGKAFIRIPKKASAEIPPRPHVMIEGVANRVPFCLSLDFDAKEEPGFRFSPAMRAAIGATNIDTVTVEITRIANEPEVRIPADLKKSLRKEPKAWSSWLDITPMARRDWILSVITSKQPETRVRRIEKARDMLRVGKRRLCCFPGVKWIMRDNAKTLGTWSPLPTDTPQK